MIPEQLSVTVSGMQHTSAQSFLPQLQALPAHQSAHPGSWVEAPALQSFPAAPS